MTFRQLEKEDLSVLLPPEINGEVRLLAAETKRSISETATELLCLALGRDPVAFRVRPALPDRRGQRVAS